MINFNSSESDGDDPGPLSEINVVPLVDVMLVLLVIFIITAPLLTHSVKIDLPRAASNPNITKRGSIQLAIDGAGVVFWNGEAADRVEINRRLEASATLDPQPELHIHADGATPYKRVAEVLSDAAKAGMVRIGFVTDPHL